MAKGFEFSAVVIARDEADNIRPCLEALLQVTTQIWVVDSGSLDGTPEIARSLGARVHATEWLGYSATKNLGNSLPSTDWILSIDADEVLSPGLILSLQAWTPEAGKVYALDRLTNYCGHWVRHSGWYPDWKVRLFDRRTTRWEGDFLHEKLAFPPGTEVVRLSGKLLHYSYKSSDDHWRRMERYARLAAEEMLARGKKPGWWKRALSPAFRFFRTLILKSAWRDGRTGWTIAWRNAWLVRRKYQILREMRTFV